MFTFFLICFLLIHFESASFFYGQPCSELNTIYLHQFSSKIILEKNHRNLKKIQHYCIDVTKIDDITDLYRIRYSIEERSLKIFYATDTLYADNMRLRKLPINFLFNLPNLKMLDLSGNKIRKINTKIYKYSPSLEKLLLADNRILIPRKYPLIKSSTLELLMLTRNNIHQIYKLTFSKLPNLKILYLNENKILFICI